MVHGMESLYFATMKHNIIMLGLNQNAKACPKCIYIKDFTKLQYPITQNIYEKFMVVNFVKLEENHLINILLFQFIKNSCW